MPSATLRKDQHEPLPAVNGDFYLLAETLAADDGGM